MCVGNCPSTPPIMSATVCSTEDEFSSDHVVLKFNIRLRSALVCRNADFDKMISEITKTNLTNIVNSSANIDDTWYHEI